MGNPLEGRGIRIAIDVCKFFHLAKDNVAHDE